MKKNRKFIQSLRCALRGIGVTVKTQRNMRFHISMAIAVLISAFIVNVSETHVLLIVMAIALVISAELINTAIESDVDLTTDKYDPHARDAKDIAAGGVLFAAIAALVVGCVVFFKDGKVILLVTRICSSWIYITLTVLYVILALIFTFCRKN